MAGIIAIVSTLLLAKQGFDYLVDQRISERLTPPPNDAEEQQPTTQATGDSIPPTIDNSPVVDPYPGTGLYVSFREGQAALTPEGLTAITAAASQCMQQSQLVELRIVSLGPVESAPDLWRARLYAVRDELVRLGLPASRIRHDGLGPFAVFLLPTSQERQATEPKRPLYEVTQIDVRLSSGTPAYAIVTVEGFASTAGWKNVELRPLQTFAPEVGMRSFTLIGTPPVGVAVQALTRVHATALIDPLASDVKTIRVLTETNEAARTFR